MYITTAQDCRSTTNVFATQNYVPEMSFLVTQIPVSSNRYEFASSYNYIKSSDGMRTSKPKYQSDSIIQLTEYESTSFQKQLNTTMSIFVEYSAINQTSIKDNLDKLSRIAHLGNNWNGYGADPIDISIINEMEMLLPHLVVQPQIFPTACNSIQFEYEKPDGDYMEFTVSIDSISAYVMYENGCENYYEDIKSIHKINELIKKFYGIHVV